MIKLKFPASGDLIELPLETRECFEKTIGQLKKEQFSLEERRSLTLVHNGAKLADAERLFDLLTPQQTVSQCSLASPKTQYIVI